MFTRKNKPVAQQYEEDAAGRGGPDAQQYQLSFIITGVHRKIVAKRC